MRFQSTPPARGATDGILRGSGRLAISIHAPREGGDIITAPCLRQSPFISIHAPREGGDGFALITVWNIWISIHAPREGGDFYFLRSRHERHDFNPRPPRGGRPDYESITFWQSIISIHAPREGGDVYAGKCGSGIMISIHAPREGGDSKDAQFYLRIFDKQVELLRFLGKIRGWLPEKPGERPAFSREKPCEPPGNLWSLGLRGGGKARPGYPCAVPLPRRAACVRGSGDPPADRCSSYRNAPLFSHIASPDSKSADCLSQNP